MAALVGSKVVPDPASVEQLKARKVAPNVRLGDIAEITEHSGLHRLSQTSDPFFIAGEGGVTAIAATVDRKVEFVACSGSMREVLENLRRVAPLDTTVLIEGDTGTGKDLVARAIHAASPRDAHPLVKVILLEQIYRAWSIISNHPYHRG